MGEPERLAVDILGPAVAYVRAKQRHLEARLARQEEQHELAVRALLDGWHECAKTDGEIGTSGPDTVRLGYLLGSVKKALAALNEAAPPSDQPWPTAEELR